MLFISDNNKIDAIIKRLQPSLKLKINIERDFDCGLNDVFEKRPDVVFIQNQIAGVTGESVARHIQLLLGGTAPKFIFIHDGDAKAKPKKGLYEYLIDLSQSEKAVVADILEKLHLLLGSQWQNIFVTSVLQGAEYEAVTPAPEAPLDPVSSFAFDIVPGIEPVVPNPTPDESYDVIPPTYGQCPENTFEERSPLDKKGKTTVSGDNFTSEEISAASEAAAPFADGALSAVALQKSRQAGAGSTVVSGQAERTTGRVGLPPAAPEDSQSPVAAAAADRNPLATAAPHLNAADKPSSLADRGGVPKETPPVNAQKELLWVFEGEPGLKKSNWKRYQFVELLLVLCLLLGGGYFIKQKMQPLQPVAEEVNLLTAAATSPQMQDTAPAAQPPRTVALPSFIPIAGLDPAFALQNAGWERYAGAGVEYRLFRENGKLKAVQVKAEKGHVISDPLLQSILAELTGSAEYHVKSRENKLGFQVSTAHVNGKAEMLIYRKKTAVHAFVVSLD